MGCLASNFGLFVLVSILERKFPSEKYVTHVLIKLFLYLVLHCFPCFTAKPSEKFPNIFHLVFNENRILLISVDIISWKYIFHVQSAMRKNKKPSKSIMTKKKRMTDLSLTWNETVKLLQKLFVSVITTHSTIAYMLLLLK